MIKIFKNLSFDYENNIVRGSFVNLLATFVIIVLFCVGAFNKDVDDNLKEMSTLILGFFGVSFSVWTYGKIQKNKSSNE